MDKPQWAKIAQKIVDAYRDPFTEDQFELWFSQFQREEYSVADRACNVMVSEFKYFPVPATFREYLKRTKEQDEAQAESIAKAKQRKDGCTPRANGKSHFRFTRYMLEHKEQFKGWLDGTMQIEEYERLRAKFQKEHPNWQPPQRSTKGMRKVGDVLASKPF